MKNKKYALYEVPQPDSFDRLLRYGAQNYADKTAFWYADGGETVRISYARLQKDVRALALYLHNAGLSRMQIGILGENSYEWIVAYFAIVLSDNVVIPVDKELPAEDIAAVLKRGDAKALFYSSAYSEEAAANTDLLLIDMKTVAEICGTPQLEYPLATDIRAMCTLAFTSGTTGEPKGVMLSQYGLMKDAVTSSQNLLVPEGSVLVLPLYHTFGFMSGVLCQLLKGYPVYINTSIRRVLSDIRFAAPRHICAVPLLLQVLYDQIWNNIRKSGKEETVRKLLKYSNSLLLEGKDVRRKLFKEVLEGLGGSLEMLVTGGAPVDPRLVEGFRELGIQVITGYGITECSPIVATMRNRHYRPDAAGTVHPESEVRIVEGEIQIRGPIVFLGYYKDAEATKAAFDGEWFRTGDIGYLDDEGLLHVTGRIKNLIILANGKNVAAEELEAKLRQQIEEIAEVVIYEDGKQIAAEIYADPDKPDAENKIMQKIHALNQKLPQYKRIAKTVFRPVEFLKTTTKKIIRNHGGKKDAGENQGDDHR